MTILLILLAVVGPFVDAVPPARLTEPLKELIEKVRAKLKALEGYISTSLRRIAAQHPNEFLMGCPNCRLEGTLIVDDGPICLFCGYSGKAERVADECSRAFFPGEDRHVYRCPHCRRVTLLDVGATDEDPWYKCFACGDSWALDDLYFCSWCGHPFEPPAGDPDEDLCEVCRGEEE